MTAFLFQRKRRPGFLSGPLGILKSPSLSFAGSHRHLNDVAWEQSPSTSLVHRSRRLCSVTIYCGSSAQHQGRKEEDRMACYGSLQIPFVLSLADTCLWLTAQ